jgi:branched-chain amino acid transport system permease protein
MPSPSLVVSQLFNGLAVGALLALVSSGLTIIFGTLGVVNFAHGAFFTLGAYAGWVTFENTHSFVLAMAAGAVVTGVLGLALERGLVRRFYDRPPEDQILVTFGIGIVVVESLRAWFGGLSQNMPQPEWGNGIVNFGFFFYPTYRLQVLGIAAGALFVLYVVLYWTRIGLIVRAGIEDNLMVRMLGIRVPRVLMLVFGLGALAAGFAGVVNAPIISVAPDIGARVLVQSFVVVVIGGLGSFPGAIVGGLIAGEILSVTSIFNPQYSDVMLYAAMALVLFLLPRGLFGTEGRA